MVDQKGLYKNLTYSKGTCASKNLHKQVHKIKTSTEYNHLTF